jgi:hypothetical protein
LGQPLPRPGPDNGPPTGDSRDEHLTNEKVEKFYHEYPKSFETPAELWIQEILVSDLDEAMPEKRHALHPTQSP